eukprot:COSAG06_NODE_14176_length_1181_cov_16.263401_2_plen_116_part_00
MMAESEQSVSASVYNGTPLLVLHIPNFVSIKKIGPFWQSESGVGFLLPHGSDPLSSKAILLVHRMNLRLSCRANEPSPVIRSDNAIILTVLSTAGTVDAVAGISSTQSATASSTV